MNPLLATSNTGYGVQDKQNANAEIGNKVGYSPGTVYAMPESTLNKAYDERLQGNQYEQNSKLSSQQAGQAYLNDRQQGAFSVLNNLLSKGYIDGSQKDAAGSWLQKLLDELGGAKGLATSYAQDGGLSPDALAFLAGEYGNVQGKANTLAERGGLTIDEYNRILNSGRNDMMRQGRNAAEATFNQSNAGASPFAAAALQNQTAANTGAEMVKQRAALDQYQSDTRIKGNEQLADLLKLASGTLMEQAGNKGKGLSALNDILGLEGGAYGKLAELETKTSPTSGSLSIVDQLLNELGLGASVSKDKKGNIKAKTAYGDAVQRNNSASKSGLNYYG